MKVIILRRHVRSYHAKIEEFRKTLGLLTNCFHATDSSDDVLSYLRSNCSSEERFLILFGTMFNGEIGEARLFQAALKSSYPNAVCFSWSNVSVESSAECPLDGILDDSISYTNLLTQLPHIITGRFDNQSAKDIHYHILDSL